MSAGKINSTLEEDGEICSDGEEDKSISLSNIKQPGCKKPKNFRKHLTDSEEEQGNFFNKYFHIKTHYFL